MAKKSGKTKRQKQAPSSRRPGARTSAKAPKRASRKAAGGRTAKAKGRKKAASPARKLKRTVKAPARQAAGAAKRKSLARRPSVKRSVAKASPAKKAARRPSPVKKAARRPSPVKKAARRPSPVKRAARGPSPSQTAGGTGREETLAQTPEAGRTSRGPTNPMPTRRSTGTPAGAGTSRSPRLDRDRKQLREIDETVPSPPSSLDLNSQGPSAARSGRKHLQDTKEEHTETSPVMTGGDVDADWEDAYSVGDEAPGGDNPTPDQDRVDDIGKALGVTYDDNEELKASEKIANRDKHRWELDPASSEDYTDRD
jgi:hypothetical protein